MAVATDDDLHLGNGKTGQPGTGGGAPPAPDSQDIDAIVDHALGEQGGGGEGGGQGAEGAGGGEDAPLTEDERDLVRQRRKQERRDQKQRKRDAIDRRERLVQQLSHQLSEANERINQLESRQGGSEMGRLDAAINEAASAIDIARSAQVEARKANNAEIELEAQEAWYAAKRRHEELTAYKARLVNANGAPRRPQVDQRIATNATNWLKDNNWYNPRGDDDDSDMVRRIDKQLMNERWDPALPGYWDELTDRLRERLPHRFREDDGEGGGNNGQRRRNSNDITSGAGGESPGGGNGNGRAAGSFKLSQERIDAMKEAGIWDDPKRRARMIQRYAANDREEAARRRAQGA